MSNTVHQPSYSNGLFFRYAPSHEDEGPVYTRNTIIGRVTGIRVKESTVFNPNPDLGTILDVHMKDEQNRHFNVGVWTTYRRLAGMMRFKLYGARALNNQLNSDRKYRGLKPVYQIIFIDEHAWGSRNLVNQYQTRDKQGEKESYYPLTLRIYVHVPAISDIIREEGVQGLNGLEQLVYSFENDGENNILKLKEKLVKVFMDKHEGIQKDGELRLTAMVTQMGEARYRYGSEDNFEEGKIERRGIGIQGGRISLLLKLSKNKHHEDCSVWLLFLNDEQMEAMPSLILICNSFQELKDQVTIIK